MSSTPTTILDCANSQLVEAEILDGLVPEDLMLLEAEWRPHRSRTLRALLRTTISGEERPQSLQWNWQAKAHHLRLMQASGYAIVYEEQWQGAMLTKSATQFARLSESLGGPLVYIDFLEVAPWNWEVSAIDQLRRYALIGPRLFEQAVQQSWNEGFGGIVGLHALPQSERFYTDACTMTPMGSDEDHEDLTYFELSRDNAERILERIN